MRLERLLSYQKETAQLALLLINYVPILRSGPGPWQTQECGTAHAYPSISEKNVFFLFCSSGTIPSAAIRGKHLIGKQNTTADVGVSRTILVGW